ncbi:hypothetical protein DL767_010448 [Monosporascus sp. MG133]|nr:hypothetical protein DL767_010448 [Monosporascus sp. MG133]
MELEFSSSMWMNGLLQYWVEASCCHPTLVPSLLVALLLDVMWILDMFVYKASSHGVYTSNQRYVAGSVPGHGSVDDFIPINIAEPEMTRRLPSDMEVITRSRIIGYAAIVNGDLCTCEPVYGVVTMYELLDQNKLMPLTSLRWVEMDTTTRVRHSATVSGDMDRSARCYLKRGPLLAYTNVAVLEAANHTSDSTFWRQLYTPLETTKGGGRVRELAFGMYPKIETFRTRELISEIMASTWKRICEPNMPVLHIFEAAKVIVVSTTTTGVLIRPMRRRVLHGDFVPEGPYADTMAIYNSDTSSNCRCHITDLDCQQSVAAIRQSPNGHATTPKKVVARLCVATYSSSW